MTGVEVDQQGWKGRWRRRRGLALCVRLLAVAAPVVLAVGLAALGHWLVVLFGFELPWALWWTVVSLVVMAGLFVGDRLARRLLPLAAFLQLSLVFPDRAPSRFRLALRASTTR